LKRKLMVLLYDRLPYFFTLENNILYFTGGCRHKRCANFITLLLIVQSSPSYFLINNIFYSMLCFSQTFHYPNNISICNM
jgi:hypothetical protein